MASLRYSLTSAAVLAALCLPVAGSPKPDRPLSFLNDILPILSKSGCNSSGCHSKPRGRNGYMLSVFSYDPLNDYHETVHELDGRRVSPAAPEQSLLLQKPTLTLPHEGGQRFTKDSPEYHTIARWIAAGMPYQLDDEPTLERVSISPSTISVSGDSTGEITTTAHFSNGTSRDVSALSHFSSSDPSFAEVTADGSFKITATRSGEATLVTRYMGFVDIATLTLAPENQLPRSDYAGLPRHNFIDDHAIDRWHELGLLPSEPCTDSEFIRRASLDLTGTLPSPEQATTFLADTSPDKRTKLVDTLLAHPAWADYWALKWIDLLRPNPDRAGVKSIYVLDDWVRASFRHNKPYDQFAREIVTASGNTHRDGPAVVFRDRRTPDDLTTSFSQIFMGTRLECARCHQHPNEQWSQADFYHLAAFFGQTKRKGTGISPPISGSAEFFYHAPGGSVSHPVTGVALAPKPPGESAPEIDGTDPRHALATWLTNPANPFFARAAVNRVWAAMMGTGFVTPVDDFRTSNPPSNVPLLDALAHDFASHGYDLKHLMRRIANSHTYQLSSTPNTSNLTDTRHFSRAYRRRLPAEAMADAVATATGVPDSFEGMPAGARAIEAWNFKLSSNMLDAFGRPDAAEDCPCERDLGTSLVQALNLMNSKLLDGKLTHASGRATRLASSGTPPADIVDQLYLATLTRLPNPDEKSLALAQYSLPDATAQTATEDVLWSLINSAEFVFNH
ncbi:MAG: DUF1549 and DUF1553 domain-containing protein [Verrucomicrobiales bacterium]|nr:DUF1549 and DUF1553 domain-containing protein [Verrucomicrobiales bacterium]